MARRTPWASRPPAAAAAAASSRVKSGRLGLRYIATPPQHDPSCTNATRSSFSNPLGTSTTW
jgi:hypothetical protein